MQENVVGTAHLIHNSMNELTRAIHCAHTTLYNSINAFNALNFNKFLENVGTLLIAFYFLQVIEEKSPQQQQESGEDQGLMFGGDMRTEDEKLSFALEMAFNEISKDKEATDADETNTTQN